MKPIIALNETVVQVKVPLPFPLRWVNSYLIKGSQGYTLLDPGLHTPDAEALWEEVLLELGIGYADVEQIVLTHHHPDHYGLAGWFQEQSNAPVLMSRSAREQALKLWGGQAQLGAEIVRLFLRHGMDGDTAAQIDRHMDSFIPLVSPQPVRIQELHEGEFVRLGDREYRCVHTPGHALGHLIFYGEEEQLVWCGDHVLPQITPNVSYLPGGDPDPLQSFLDSLRGLKSLGPVKLAYPGHRDPFEGFHERAAEIVRHHGQRLSEMEQLLAEGPLTAYELCRKLFGDRLSAHQLRFAMSETIAHTVHMSRTGAAAAEEADSVIRYRIVP